MLQNLVETMQKMGGAPIAFYPVLEITTPCSTPFYAHGVVLHRGQIRVLDYMGYGHDLEESDIRVIVARAERVNQIANAKNNIPCS